MRGLSPDDEVGLAGRVQAILEQRLDPRAGAPLAVGFSGGGDSRALLGLVAGWARSRGRRVLAITVDHRLQPDSAAWSKAAESVARAVGCDWVGVAWSGIKPATGIPAAARAARHRLLAAAAREVGASVLLLGHTRDDRLESALIRRFDPPGPGDLREWSPSPAWPEGRGVFCLRPLLGERRLALRRLLVAAGADWIEDPANADPGQARARARLRLESGEPPPRLPPGDAGPPDRLEDVLVAAPAGSLETEAAALQGLSPPARRRLVALAATCAGGASGPPDGAACERLADLLAAGRPFVRSLNGARIEAKGGRVAFRREAGEYRRGSSPEPLALEPRVASVWDGRFLLERSPADGPAGGLYAVPLGGWGARLPTGDRRLARAVSSADRPTLPVLLGTLGPTLPEPFGTGPGRAVSLVGPRFRAAAGAARCEREISRIFLADRPYSSYVDPLAPA